MVVVTTTATSSNVGFGLADLQYKFRNDQFSPFVRVLAGADAYQPGGSGLRVACGSWWRWRFRPDADQFHRHCESRRRTTSTLPTIRQTFTGHSSTWNSVRLSTGVVFNLGNYYTAPVSAACTANPTTPVFAGEPVTVYHDRDELQPQAHVDVCLDGYGRQAGKPDRGRLQRRHDGLWRLAPTRRTPLSPTQRGRRTTRRVARPASR